MFGFWEIVGLWFLIGVVSSIIWVYYQTYVSLHRNYVKPTRDNEIIACHIITVIVSWPVLYLILFVMSMTFLIHKAIEKLTSKELFP